MGVRDWLARRGGGVQLAAAEDKPSAPSTAALVREEAVEQLLSVLEYQPDVDLVLEQLGVPRAALRKLESDDEVSGALETRRDALVGTPWHLQPAETAVARYVAEELEPHLHGILEGAWQALPYGYSVLEAVYRRDPADRRRVAGLERVAIKPFEWFTPRRDGTLWLEPPGEQGRAVDAHFKFHLTANRATYRQPYGEALLSRLYWPWFFRTQGWTFWMQFLERHGTPLLLGKGTNPNALAQALAQAVQDAVVAVGNNDEVTAIETRGSGESFSRIEDALVRRIHRRILGQTLTSGAQGGSQGGSMALGRVQDRVREDKRVADVRLVTPTVQRIIDALVLLRFGPQAEPPRFIMEDAPQLETERAERDEVLHRMGVRFSEEYLQRVYGLEPSDFKVVEAAASPLGFQAGRQPLGAELFTEAVARSTPSAAQAQVDGVVEGVMPRAPSPIRPAVLRQVIEASSDPDDLAERLAQLFEAEGLPAGARSGAFRELLEQAMFAADVLGYSQASEEG